MKKYFWLILLIVVYLQNVYPQQSTSLDNERASLLKTDSDFNKFAQEKGTVDAFLTYMAEDAVLFPAGSNPVTGRENTHKHLSDGPPDAALTWQPLKADVANSADLGYTYGTYEYKFIDKDGKPAVRYGKYITVWQEQAEGTWKFVLDIGNQSPAPEDR